MMTTPPNIENTSNALNLLSAAQASTCCHFGSRLSTLLYVIVRWTLGGVFFFSGVLKLSDPQQFGHIIEAYGLISPQFVVPAAIGLSLLEAIAGLGLVLDVQYVLTVITGLLILFIIILGYGLFLGLDVDCGCFGSDDTVGKAFHNLRPALYRDLAMLSGVGFLYVWRHKTGFSPKTLCLFHPFRLRRFLQ
jgi:uncharacterized membrane protein YphA (DoxX/SURF4 family)